MWKKSVRRASAHQQAHSSSNVNGAGDASSTPTSSHGAECATPLRPGRAAPGEAPSTPPPRHVAECATPPRPWRIAPDLQLALPASRLKAPVSSAPEQRPQTKWNGCYGRRFSMEASTPFTENGEASEQAPAPSLLRPPKSLFQLARAHSKKLKNGEATERDSLQSLLQPPRSLFHAARAHSKTCVQALRRKVLQKSQPAIPLPVLHQVPGKLGKKCQQVLSRSLSQITHRIAPSKSGCRVAQTGSKEILSRRSLRTQHDAYSNSAVCSDVALPESVPVLSEALTVSQISSATTCTNADIDMHLLQWRRCSCGGHQTSVEEMLLASDDCKITFAQLRTWEEVMSGYLFSKVADSPPASTVLEDWQTPILRIAALLDPRYSRNEEAQGIAVLFDLPDIVIRALRALRPLGGEANSNTSVRLLLLVVAGISEKHKGGAEDLISGGALEEIAFILKSWLSDVLIQKCCLQALANFAASESSEFADKAMQAGLLQYVCNAMLEHSDEVDFETFGHYILRRTANRVAAAASSLAEEPFGNAMVPHFAISSEVGSDTETI